MSRSNKSWQADFEHVILELSERDVTGHDTALDKAVRILEDVIQRIDDGEKPQE
jgi:hypothetical protein